MLDYDDGVLFAVIAACLYTEDLSLATGGPLDPLPDIPVPIFAFQLRTLVHLERGCGAAF